MTRNIKNKFEACELCTYHDVCEVCDELKAWFTEFEKESREDVEKANKKQFEILAKDSHENSRYRIKISYWEGYIKAKREVLGL